MEANFSHGFTQSYNFGEFHRNSTGSGREGKIEIHIGINKVAIDAIESRSGLSFNFKRNCEKVKSSNGHIVYIAKAALREAEMKASDSTTAASGSTTAASGSATTASGSATTASGSATTTSAGVNALGSTLSRTRGQPGVRWISNESTIEKWIDKPAIQGDSHKILAIRDGSNAMYLDFGPWLNEGKPALDYIPAVNPQIDYQREQSGEKINLEIEQSSTLKEHDRIRSLAYSRTDVFLLPYNDEYHLKDIERLLPEIERHRPGAKIAFIQVTDKNGKSNSELQAQALALAKGYSKGRSCPIPVVEVNPYNAGKEGQHSLLLAVNRFCEYKPQGK